ncbi:hypothetical protein CVT24_004660 [Panaeolus cyanescens]|uniref:DUF6534 domain-containing protein n=1 Tax=Panaeolus cyanescens TaxID=181874 RepID=A0A409YSG9_9AGAR|nr:hypothetical protein CVT24_004660 [Panaeolus cyanescens]
MIDPSYGALLIGVAFAIFFQGVLTVQAFHYFSEYPDDRMRNKILVSFLCMLDFVHLVVIFKGEYGALVTDYASRGVIGIEPMEINLHFVFTGVSCLVTQLFYLERLWIFSRRNIMVLLPILVIAVVPLVLNFYLGAICIKNTILNEHWKTTTETGVMFVTGAVSDALIALVTWYYLGREKTIFQSTRNLVTRAIIMVLTTGAATALVAIATMISFFSNSASFTYTAIHLQLGRTYTIALLANLNSRRIIRETGSDDGCRTAPLQFAHTAGTGRVTGDFAASRAVYVVQQETTQDVGSVILNDSASTSARGSMEEKPHAKV